MERNLPTIIELYNEQDLVLREKENSFNVLMNQPPKADWVKTHPMTKGAYLPIERVDHGYPKHLTK